MDWQEYQAEIRLWVKEWRDAKKQLRGKTWTQYISSLGFKDASYISKLIKKGIDIHLEHVFILAATESMTPSEFLKMIEARLKEK